MFSYKTLDSVGIAVSSLIFHGFAVQAGIFLLVCSYFFFFDRSIVAITTGVVLTVARWMKFVLTNPSGRARMIFSSTPVSLWAHCFHICSVLYDSKENHSAAEQKRDGLAKNRTSQPGRLKQTGNDVCNPFSFSFATTSTFFLTSCRSLTTCLFSFNSTYIWNTKSSPDGRLALFRNTAASIHGVPERARLKRGTWLNL